MKRFLRTLVRWTEPREFGRIDDRNTRKSRPRWALPGLWLALSGMLLCTAWLGRLKREILDGNSESELPSWSAVLVFLPIAAAFLTAMIFTAARFGRRTFRITERGIGSDKHLVPFHQIEDAVWVDGGSFHVLKLSLNNSPPRLYGVPDPQTRSTIESLLRERGIESKPLNATVESLFVGGSTAVYKLMIGVFAAMTIWCTGLGVSLNSLVSDLNVLKANVAELDAKRDLLSQQLKAAGLPSKNLKNVSEAENAVLKEGFQRLLRMELILAGLWSAFCFVIGFFLVRSVTDNLKTQDTTSKGV